jgi:Membrane bound O-acyl transferase family
LNTITQTAAASATKKSPWIGWLPLLALPFFAIVFRSHMPAWVFMWTLSFAIFAGLKWMTWWQAREQVRHKTVRSLAYLLAWPGMDAETFLGPSQLVERPHFNQWLWAAAKTLLGLVLLWFVARRVPADVLLLRGWIGLFGLIFLLHFGSFHLIALFWQTMGIDAPPIMANPILSKTLAEFWGKRWNLGFRQLAHEFIFRPLQKHLGATVAGLCVFFASGLIHDLVISLPARGGYGLPTAYFLLQGFGVMFERSALARRVGLQKDFAARIFTVVVTAAPAFWLFHPPFVRCVILPFMHAIRAL